MEIIDLIALGVSGNAKSLIKRLLVVYAVTMCGSGNAISQLIIEIHYILIQQNKHKMDLLHSVHIHNCFQQRDKKTIRFDIAPTRDFGYEQLVYKHSFCYNLFFGLFSYQLVIEKRVCRMVHNRKQLK